MVAEWVARGHADSTHRQILEFAPGVLDDPEVVMPPWFGDAAVHLSHRSNLVQKAPEIYRDRSPGVPEDLPYTWPEPEQEVLPVEPSSNRLWVWRAASHPPERAATLLMPFSPRIDKASPKWERQLRAFEESMAEGDPVAVADPAGERFRTGRLGRVLVHEDGLIRPAVLDGWLERSEIDPPALLQEPRTLFSVAMPDVAR